MESHDRLGLRFLYLIDPRRSWPFLQTRSQSRQLLASPHGQYLNAAIMIVAHPPGNLQDVRLTLYKPPETDALHTSPHQKTASIDGRLIVCGSHRL